MSTLPEETSGRLEGQGEPPPRRSFTLDQIRAEASTNPPDPAQFSKRLADYLSSNVGVRGSILEAAREAASAASAHLETLFETNPMSMRFDFGNLLGKDMFPELAAAAARIGETVRRKIPPNWPDGADWEQIVTVIQDDGIPLVWVPRAGIVEAVVSAPTRAERIRIIVGRCADIVEDCRFILSEVADAELAGQVALARAAVEALAAGHHQAAQALAVVVTETAVATAIDHRYANVKREVKVADPGALTLADLRLRAALAPVGSFYTPWWPDSGNPPPEALSRHVSVHQADVEHYSLENALLSVMLVSSILPALSEFYALEDPL